MRLVKVKFYRDDPHGRRRRIAATMLKGEKPSRPGWRGGPDGRGEPGRAPRLCLSGCRTVKAASESSDSGTAAQCCPRRIQQNPSSRRDILYGVRLPSIIKRAGLKSPPENPGG